MEQQLSSEFAAAVRNELVSLVEGRQRPRRRMWIGAGVVLAGVVLAGGGTAIASTIWSIPGTPRVTTLTKAVHVNETGTATVELGAAPAHTNTVHLDLVCLTAGMFVFPDGASVTCGPSDIGTRSDETTYDMAAKAGQTSVTISTSPNARWSLTAEWTLATLTKWAVNSHGQTYGAMNTRGSPDLIAVEATNGKLGYVLATQLNHADSPNFTSPAQAIAWQKAHAGEVIEIPVYLSNGTTKIGVFDIGG